MTDTQVLGVRVRSMTLLAEETLAVEFVPGDGGSLPAFEAGAHIDLHLPNGIRRSYSLCNRPGETARYVVGIKRASPSRGASAYIHDFLRVGQRLSVSLPRNNFPLAEGASRSVLIAGGIGITPIWSMVQSLEAAAADWRLYYAARTRSDAAFRTELQALEASRPGRIDIHFDHEPSGTMLDMARIVAQHDGPGVHFYACGPAPLLDAYERAAAALPPDRRHLERFTGDAKAASAAALAEFDVVLSRSGQTLHIGRGANILDTLLDAGVNIPFSCMEGICGSCKVKVIDGLPDHRDSVLSAEEQAQNTHMMACCSGSRSERLVLDI